MPSLFAFHPDEKGYQLKGMGNGPKGPTDAALNELRTLTAQDIKALLEQTKAVKGK
jgi:hypothetical protein